jgi:hypothetical protein
VATKEQVEEFLRQLRDKMDLSKVVFEDEDPKDTFTAFKLELSQSQRAEYVKRLTYREYSDGPKEDEVHGGGYWEFGKRVKNELIYIKVNMGMRGKPVILISFHFAERRMTFPLK